MNYKYKLYGAILGDLAGQPYEFKYKGDYSEFNIHNPNSYFTDDTIMTLATAKALLEGDNNFKKWYLILGSKYFNEDYFGKRFKKWIQDETAMEQSQSDSWGNGCLMRISPIMYTTTRKELGERRELVVESCLCSHNHTKSIVACLDLHKEYWGASLRKHAGKYQPQNHIKKFEKFDVSADGTMEFIKNAYWLCNSTVEAISKSITYGGDTDTNASILGELMNYTFQDLSRDDTEYVESKLDSYLLNILLEFNKKF